MTSPRKEILNEGQVSVYHCVSRCVRRAFLCGLDRLTGRDYTHRKHLIVERIKFLTGVFTIEVLVYAIMCTHYHLILRTRPDKRDKLPDEEVARRWLLLYPKRKNGDGTPCEPNRTEIELLTSDKELIGVLRSRLGSISWFMKSVNEYVARIANLEDECTGRFWEGRFKCQRLYSSAVILTCATYIDLNLIRAKMADTPEKSYYSSAGERIREIKKEREAPFRKAEEKLWLAPLSDTGDRIGFLPVDLPTYLKILDSTGREFRKGKRGAIPEDLEPILERLGIRSSAWLDTTGKFCERFYRYVGPVDSMMEAAKRVGKRWFKGISASRRAFHQGADLT